MSDGEPGMLARGRARRFHGTGRCVDKRQEKKRTGRKHMRKRLLSFVLAVLMIVSILPATALAADETVTRIAWVQKLVKTFDMTVEADNYPDNYYSDIDSSASYYKDLMIAVEFGVIDLEAGSAFEPDKPATREFAAHTLNFCLGFQLDEGVAYTYTDKDAVTYPEDVQVAVNRGWFQLSGGKFLPEQTVTSAEAASMLADAAKVRKGDTVQAGYDSKYVFTDGVVVVPSSVAARSRTTDRSSFRTRPWPSRRGTPLSSSWRISRAHSRPAASPTTANS